MTIHLTHASKGHRNTELSDGSILWFNWMTRTFMPIRICGDGAVLTRQWAKTDSSRDSFISGILADWLEDHIDELVADPANTRTEVMAVITGLRQCFSDPDRSHQ